MKKVFYLMKAAIVMAVMMCVYFTASAQNSGTTGSLKWNFADGTLTISGEGDMPDYDNWQHKVPWDKFSEEIKQLVIGTNVTSIGKRAFYYCSRLTSVTIPKSVTKIGAGAFSSCSSLTSITISNSVTEIGENAFINCYGLTSITIPNSVTKIGGWAFYDCNSLTSVTIPSSVTEIGNSAFPKTTVLRRETNTVAASSGSFIWNFADGTLTIIGTSDMPDYDREHRAPWNEVESKVKNVVIAPGVTSIGSRAFYNYTGLTSVTIPNSVTEIGNMAFSYCNGLTSITIPNSVTSIGNAAFEWCGLTSVTIPELVTEIGDGTFSNCTGLISVTIPKSVTRIGVSAFSSCTGLTSVIIPNPSTEIKEGAFPKQTDLRSAFNAAFISSGSSSFSHGRLAVNSGIEDRYYIDTKGNRLYPNSKAAIARMDANSIRLPGLIYHPDVEILRENLYDAGLVHMKDGTGTVRSYDGNYVGYYYVSEETANYSSQLYSKQHLRKDAFAVQHYYTPVSKTLYAITIYFTRETGLKSDMLSKWLQKEGWRGHIDKMITEWDEITQLLAATPNSLHPHGYWYVHNKYPGYTITMSDWELTLIDLSKRGVMTVEINKIRDTMLRKNQQKEDNLLNSW